MNSNKYWMKRKRYGWGWIPTTWAGWLIVILQIGVVLTAAIQLPTKPEEPSLVQFAGFFITVAFAITTLILISIRTAPAPRWRWGKKDTDNSDEDF